MPLGTMPPASPARTTARRRLLRGGLVLLGAWLGTAAGPACTLELVSGFSCGDGYWNEEAGEECDPGVPESYVNECVGTNRPDGQAACDPVTCTVVNDLQQCGRCGDGRVDAILEEECDGDQLAGQACPSAKGALQCTSDCKFDYSACDLCGDGTRDPGEECDPRGSDGIVANPPPCNMLAAPDPSLPYASGIAGPCTDECKWDRITCSYCGNGQIDSNRLLDSDGNVSPPEICDSTTLNQALLNQSLTDDPCWLMDDDQRSQVTCRSDCTIERLSTCCVNAAKNCPDDDAGTCCYALESDNYDPETSIACGDIFNADGTIKYNVCLGNEAHPPE